VGREGHASRHAAPVRAVVDAVVADLDAEAWNALGIATRYYNTDLHKGCFALPNYVLDMLRNADE